MYSGLRQSITELDFFILMGALRAQLQEPGARERFKSVKSIAMALEKTAKELRPYLNSISIRVYAFTVLNAILVQDEKYPKGVGDQPPFLPSRGRGRKPHLRFRILIWLLAYFYESTTGKRPSAHFRSGNINKADAFAGPFVRYVEDALARYIGDKPIPGWPAGETARARAVAEALKEDPWRQAMRRSKTRKS